MHYGNFWDVVTTEYNDEDKIEYGELAHDVQWPMTKPNPAVFAQVTAVQLIESYKKMTKNYDRVIANWKKSGNHEIDLPTKPISDFTDQYILLYLHKFVHAYPEILSLVIKSLPEGVFTESTNNNNRRKRKGPPNNRNNRATGAQ
jgi:hypothetical protein